MTLPGESSAIIWYISYAIPPAIAVSKILLARNAIMKQLDYLLNEQRAQRSDLADLLRLANRKYSYYDKPTVTKTLDEYETSPQTDSDEQ